MLAASSETGSSAMCGAESEGLSVMKTHRLFDAGWTHRRDNGRRFIARAENLAVAMAELQKMPRAAGDASQP